MNKEYVLRFKENDTRKKVKVERVKLIFSDQRPKLVLQHHFFQYISITTN